MNLPACLLAIAVTRHYGWLLWAAEDRGVASKLLGSMAALCLLALVVWAYRSRWVWVVGGYYAFEELQTVLCSAAYLVQPWPIEAGQPMCSAAVGFDIGAVTILAVAYINWRIAQCVKSDSIEKRSKGIK